MQKASWKWPIKLNSSLVRSFIGEQANCGSWVDSHAVSTLLILSAESYVNVSVVLENLYVFHCFVYDRFPLAVVKHIAPTQISTLDVKAGLCA